MAEQLLLLPEVRRRTGMSTSTLYARMAASTFPRPLKRGRTSVWVESEVQSAIDRDIATLPRMGQSMGARRRDKEKAA
jgi:prophage regulatory protein